MVSASRTSASASARSSADSSPSSFWLKSHCRRSSSAFGQLRSSPLRSTCPTWQTYACPTDDATPRRSALALQPAIHRASASLRTLFVAVLGKCVDGEPLSAAEDGEHQDVIFANGVHDTVGSQVTSRMSSCCTSGTTLPTEGKRAVGWIVCRAFLTHARAVFGSSRAI